MSQSERKRHPMIELQRAARRHLGYWAKNLGQYTDWGVGKPCRHPRPNDKFAPTNRVGARKDDHELRGAQKAEAGRTKRQRAQAESRMQKALAVERLKKDQKDSVLHPDNPMVDPGQRRKLRRLAPAKGRLHVAKNLTDALRRVRGKGAPMTRTEGGIVLPGGAA